MFNIFKHQRNANQAKLKFHFTPVKITIIKK
jgi:hypothetical protein